MTGNPINVEELEREGYLKPGWKNPPSNWWRIPDEGEIAAHHVEWMKRVEARSISAKARYQKKRAERLSRPPWRHVSEILTGFSEDWFR